MRGGVTAALVFVSLLVAAPPSGARSSRSLSGVQSMTVAASPNRAGAHRVRLTVKLRYEMQCNYPGVGPLVVTFPSALKLPKRFAAGAVTLAGKPVAATAKRRRVTVAIAPPKGVLCGMVGPGSVKLVFTRKAKVANSERAGSYRFRATHAGRAFAAKLAIEPGS